MSVENFLLNTDYPIDQIIGYGSGSVTIPSFGFNDPIITHGYSFAPLYYIRWSYTSTFDVSYEETGRISAEVLVSGETRPLTASIIISNNSTASVTVYYRIIFFRPFDQSPISDNTQIGLDDFNINTDDNLPKIYMEGYINNPGGTVSHNLGFIPQVDAWFSFSDGRKGRFMGSNMDSTFYDYKLIVTTTTLTYTKDPSMTLFTPNLYYRIYGDRI